MEPPKTEVIESYQKKKELVLSWLRTIEEASLKECQEVNFELVQDLDVLKQILEGVLRNLELFYLCPATGKARTTLRPEILELFPANFRPAVQSIFA